MTEKAATGKTGNVEDTLISSTSTMSLTDGDEQKISHSKFQEEIQMFLQPLKQAIQDQLHCDGTAGDFVRDETVPSKLLVSLCQFIWEPDTIYLEKTNLYRSSNQLAYYFLIQDGQTDLEDYLEFRPLEIMTFKAIQVFTAIIIPDVKLYSKELKSFKSLIENDRIARDENLQQAFLFLYDVLQDFYKALTGLSGADDTTQPGTETLSFENLSYISKCIVRGCSVVFARNFRLWPQERVEKMQKIVQNDESGFEWGLTLAEMYRLKRRDFRAEVTSGSCKSKWVTQEELDLLQRAMSITPENPFVRLAIFDTIIGSVRDSSGRFHCGEIHLDCMEDAMRYLYAKCLKLTEDFPKNVMFNSVISDYFVRYFPFLYFDRDISYRLLKSAYEINPNHPKTTHRLGIIWRMSFGDIQESLKWLQKTIELDPTHFNGCLEYFKTLMGIEGNSSGFPLKMQAVLDSSSSFGWSAIEKAEFQFYLGLSYFIRDEKELALKYWKNVAKINESHFLLSDMLTSSENFEWDSNLISTDKVRLWFQKEKLQLLLKSQSGEAFDQDTKKFIDRIFAIMINLRGPSKPIIPPMFDKFFSKEFHEFFNLSI